MAFLKNIWKVNTKHHKLSEELALQNAKDTENEHNDNEIIDNDNDIITFKLKYLGSTIVEKLKSSNNMNTDAVKSIIKVAKAGRKKLQRVNVAISLKGIAVTDLQGNDLFKISIYRISNCSTDATHRQVFSFIATDENETMECHAFFCSKRKTAETVTLTVAKAFSAAYEQWRILPNSSKPQKLNKITPMKQQIVVKENNENAVEEEKLIDFDDDDDDGNGAALMVTNALVLQQKWVCFDEDFVNNTHQKDLILA